MEDKDGVQYFITILRVSLMKDSTNKNRYVMIFFLCIVNLKILTGSFLSARK